MFTNLVWTFYSLKFASELNLGLETFWPSKICWKVKMTSIKFSQSQVNILTEDPLSWSWSSVSQNNPARHGWQKHCLWYEEESKQGSDSFGSFAIELLIIACGDFIWISSSSTFQGQEDWDKEDKRVMLNRFLSLSLSLSYCLSLSLLSFIFLSLSPSVCFLTICPFYIFLFYTLSFFLSFSHTETLILFLFVYSSQILFPLISLFLSLLISLTLLASLFLISHSYCLSF